MAVTTFKLTKNELFQYLTQEMENTGKNEVTYISPVSGISEEEIQEVASSFQDKKMTLGWIIERDDSSAKYVFTLTK